MHADLSRATFDFCPVLAELLRTRRAVGRTGRVYEELSALSTINNLHTIRALMHETRPMRTLEIGLSFGGSALAFCTSHKELDHPMEAQHIALDPFQTTVWDSCGIIALERAALMGYMDFRQAYSALELPKLIESGAHFGLIYIDGSHLFEDVFVDAYFAIRLLTQGGIVAFDDCSSPHVAKVLRYLRTNLRVVQEINLSCYPEGRQNLTYSVAQYFGKVQMRAFRRIGDADRAWDAPFHSF